MISAKLEGIRKYKNLLYFYFLAIQNIRMKLKNNSSYANIGKDKHFRINLTKV